MSTRFHLDLILEKKSATLFRFLSLGFFIEVDQQAKTAKKTLDF
jgi:hypothetical protein